MNTNNYILMGDQGYDGYSLLGIYTSSELAQEAIMDFEDREDYEGFKILNLAYDQKPYVANFQGIGEDNDYCQSFNFMNTVNPNYVEMITNNLRDRGESQDYIIGYLQGILNMLSDVYSNQEVIAVLQRQLQYTKPL